MEKQQQRKKLLRQEHWARQSHAGLSPTFWKEIPATTTRSKSALIKILVNVAEEAPPSLVCRWARAVPFAAEEEIKRANALVGMVLSTTNVRLCVPDDDENIMMFFLFMILFHYWSKGLRLHSLTRYGHLYF
jgi:hypothetical protein